MNVVPVIDVSRGKVVRAVQGERSAYLPIKTPLVEGSEPATVALALKNLHMSGQLYVADLDGIEGRGRNEELVPALASTLKNVDIWVDAGTVSHSEARAILAVSQATLVVGTEGAASAAQISELLAEAPSRSVLSLDFRGEVFLGPREVLSNASLWPERVIVMTLARVGADLGPDIERVRDIAMRAGAWRKVYAAGGVRNLADLYALRAAGAAGALVASALHSKKISAGDLREIAGRK